MQVPAFPTDSLYKFLALAGLAGFFIIPGFYVSQVSDAERQSLEALVEMRVLMVETESRSADLIHLGREAKSQKHVMHRIRADTKALADEVRAAEVKTKRGRQSLAAMKELGEKIVALQDRNKVLGEAADKLEAALERIRAQRVRLLTTHQRILGKNEVATSLMERLRSFRIVFWVLYLYSCGAAVAGFWLWYSRIQRYQDAIVRKQAAAD